MDMYDAFEQMAKTASGQLGNEIDVNAIMNSELNNVVDFGLWQETVEMQKKFNDGVAPGWQLDKKGIKYNYWMAVLDETVEVLGSKHWKWWKDVDKLGTVDWENVQVELIDIFHFVLSIAIQNDSSSIFFSQLINMEMDKHNPNSILKIKPNNYFDSFWEEFLTAVQYRNLSLVVIRLIEYWYKAGGDAELLFKHYRVKSSLNDIRQEFGYSKGKYSKMWLDIDTNTKVEDNVIAWKIARDIPMDSNTTKILYKSLKEYYLRHVAL